jgi:lipopolysaccharide biosynthesis regulator YciM
MTLFILRFKRLFQLVRAPRLRFLPRMVNILKREASEAVWLNSVFVLFITVMEVVPVANLGKCHACNFVK